MEPKIQKAIKKAVGYVILFAVAIAGLWGMKILSCTLPVAPVRENCFQSAALIEEEGDYSQNYVNDPRYKYLYAPQSRIDTVTEEKIMNAVYLTDAKHPVYSSLANLTVHYDTASYSEQTVKLYETGKTDVPFLELPQYWMGSTIIYRILLSIGDLACARLILQTCFTLCAAVFLCGVTKKLGAKYALAFLLGLLAVNMVVVSYSVVFSITFYIAFGAGLVLLYAKKEMPLFRTFFLVGILTAFFDWMSTPIITFMVPMLIFLLLHQEAQGWKFYGKSFAAAGGGWCIGYGATIVSKWLVTGLLLHKNIVEIGLSRFRAGLENRIEGAPEGELQYWFAAIQNNFESLNPLCWRPSRQKWMMLFGVLCILILLYLIFRKQKINLWFCGALLLTGLAPYAWYTVFRGHVFIHYWFTYRSQFATVAAVFCCFFAGIDFEKIRRCRANLINAGKRIAKSRISSKDRQ